MESQLVAENLYELPSCTICLQEMTQDLASLACGHVFHITCINQHFEYRGSCPNCQKRAVFKEIRLVVFPVNKNNGATAHLRNLLASFENSEAGQVQCLLSQIKKLSEKNDKNENDIRQYEKQTKKQTSLLDQVKRDIEAKNAELAIFRRQNALLKKQCSKLTKEVQTITSQNIDIRASLSTLQDQKKQFTQYKLLQKTAQGSSEQMANYRNQLQIKQTPPEIMAKQFYEMLQLKNLSLLKTKQKQRELAQKYRIKQDQNNKNRDQIKQLKIEIEELQNEKIKIKRKYDQLRIKYKDVAQKLKNKNQDYSQIQDGDDSMSSLSMSMKFIGLKNHTPLQPEKTNNHFTVVEKPKVQQKLSFGNKNLKKKSFEENKESKNALKNFMM